MISIKVLEPDTLDFERYSRLQREAFAEILYRSSVSDYFMRPEYYRWKYSPPAGHAKIAVVFEEKAMVASNAMFPLRIRYGDKNVIAWQSCDTATIPSSRGKGYFKECVNSLKKELQGSQIFFGFPNKNSIQGFRQLGFEEKETINIWINPFLFRLKKSSISQIIEVQAFGSQQDELSAKLITLGVPMLDRSSAYLNWRYNQHPIHQYFSFVYIENGIQKGYIVLRIADLMDMKVALIMEVLGLSPKIEHLLLKRAKAWAIQQGVNRLAMMNNIVHIIRKLWSGFIPVPSIILPKKQILMGFATDEFARTVMQMKWRINLGDWDGF